jgi:hypothetical protein
MRSRMHPGAGIRDEVRAIFDAANAKRWFCPHLLVQYRNGSIYMR